MNFAELVAAVMDQGGFDETATGSTEDEVKEWINSAYRRMVVRSKWRKAQVELGETVADQAEYALPAGVEDIEEGILVGGEPWHPVGQKALWHLKYGNASASGGVWAADYSEDGSVQIELYPAPETSGVVISALGVLAPPVLEDSDDTPIVPSDFHDAIIDGAVATGLRRIDERIGEADSFDMRFVGEIENLRRRGNARLSTGPAVMQVQGYQFR